MSQYQKGKTNLDFTEARDSEWQWHQQVCTLLQTDNHASTPPLNFLQAGCPSCRPTNSVRALKAKRLYKYYINHNHNPTLFTLMFQRPSPVEVVHNTSSGGSCHGSDVTWHDIGRTCGSVYTEGFSVLVPVHRMVVWLSVWSEVQTCTCPADATATHYLLLQ